MLPLENEHVFALSVLSPVPPYLDHTPLSLQLWVTWSPPYLDPAPYHSSL